MTLARTGMNLTTSIRTNKTKKATTFLQTASWEKKTLTWRRKKIITITTWITTGKIAIQVTLTTDTKYYPWWR